MKILLLHSFLFIQLVGYSACLEEDFVLKTATVIPGRADEPVTFPGEMPIYPGGEAQMMRDLHDSLVYPELEKSKGIQGTVLVQFFIEIDGTISEVKTFRGIANGKNLDIAAENAVKTLKTFTPAKRNGKPKRQQMTLPVRFYIPKESSGKP